MRRSQKCKGTEYPMFLNIYNFIYKLLLLNFLTLKPTSFSHVHNGQTCFLAFFQFYGSQISVKCSNYETTDSIEEEEEDSIKVIHWAINQTFHGGMVQVVTIMTRHFI